MRHMPTLVCHNIYLSIPYLDYYTRVYLSHSRDSSHAVHTHSHTIHTLFAHYSHSRRITFTAIRTLFARSHTIRTVAHCSHGRTTFAVFAQYSLPAYIIHSSFARFTHYSRHCQPNSHTIQTSFHTPIWRPNHTIRVVGASPVALIHAVFAQFTPVRICECVIGTL